MKQTILIFTVLCYAITGMAQDVIIFRDGDEIRSIVQEVGLSEVKYKRYENPTGPVYTALKKDIFMIKYQNGTKDIFESISNESGNPIASTNTQNVPDLNSLKNEFYSIGRNDVNMLKFLKANDVSQQYYQSFNKACAKARSGKSSRTTGILLNVAGTAMVFGGALYEETAIISLGGFCVSIIGDVCLISGIVKGASAGAQKSRIKNNFAEENFSNIQARNEITPQLNFGFTQNGIGLTLNF